MRHALPLGCCATAALVAAAGCCTQPDIDVAAYEYLREDPAEAVRFFQLAVELGAWEQAARCLLVESREVGSFELWIMSGRKLREFGDLSLNDIIVGTYFMKPIGRAQGGVDAAVVLILSRPTADIDQEYSLVLVRRDAAWVIDLDKTVELNASAQ